MRRSRIGIGATALLGGFLSFAAFAQDQQPQTPPTPRTQPGTGTELRVGSEAPALNLFDLKGQVIVLEFINPSDEKWVELHKNKRFGQDGKLKQTYERYKEEGIIWLTICPFNDPAGAQAQVPAGSADGHGEGSGVGPPAVAGLIPPGQVPAVEGESDGGRGAGLEGDLGEAFQLARWPGHGGGVLAKLELHDLAAGSHPGIAHCAGDGDDSVACASFDVQIGVGEGGVTQAVAEGEEIGVGTALSGRPSLRTVRADFPHTALQSLAPDGDEDDRRGDDPARSLSRRLKKWRSRDHYLRTSFDEALH